MHIFHAGAFYVELDMAAYGVEGAVFTGTAQIKWIVQLAQPEMQRQFVIHADGKYKLHCGKWVLLTMGTHVLAAEKDRTKVVTSYRPLVYIFCKQQESEGACVMLAEVRARRVTPPSVVLVVVFT